VVHASGETGAVVYEMKLTAEAGCIAGAGLLREVREHAADPGPEVIRGILDAAAGRRLGGGRGKGAAVEVGLLDQVRLGIEDRQDFLARIVDLVDRLGKPGGRLVVSQPQVRGHQFLFTLRRVIASGGNPFAESRESLLEAIGSLLKAGAEQGELRDDIDPADVMFGISGISLVAGAPEQRDQAGRLLDLLLDGLRYRSSGH
jgi:hypothetical protein